MVATATKSEVRPQEGPNGADRERDEPIRAYGALIAVYAAVTGSFLAWRAASRPGLPVDYGAKDLVTIGIATHKTSRLISKEKVTAPLRTPFTEDGESAGDAEASERPAGGVLKRTVGELVSCPYCLDMWLATGYAAGLVAAPRLTRFFATAMSAVAIADFLQIAFRAGQERT